MTFREKFHNETDWKKKVIILEIFHLVMLSRNKKWRVRDTAIKLRISIGLASEDLMLASRIVIVQDCKSRQQALKILRGQK